MLTALRSDRGFTIIEASVAMVIMGVLLAAVYSVIIRIDQEAADQVALGDTQRALRDAAHDIDVELRQANADVNNGNQVQELSWDEIKFLSYLNANSDLQLHRYWLQGDCNSGCDLVKAVYARIPASNPPAYQTTPVFTSVQATGLLASPANPAFVGQVWSGATLVDIPSCDESGATRCDFSLVEIKLKADPETAGLVAEVEITEQVRIRNAK